MRGRAPLRCVRPPAVEAGHVHVARVAVDTIGGVGETRGVEGEPQTLVALESSRGRHVHPRGMPRHPVEGCGVGGVQVEARVGRSGSADWDDKHELQHHDDREEFILLRELDREHAAGTREARSLTSSGGTSRKTGKQGARPASPASRLQSPSCASTPRGRRPTRLETFEGDISSPGSGGKGGATTRGASRPARQIACAPEV